MNEVMTLIKKYECRVVQQEQQLFSVIELGIPKIVEQEVVEKMKEIRGLDIKKKAIQ